MIKVYWLLQIYRLKKTKDFGGADRNRSIVLVSLCLNVSTYEFLRYAMQS